MGVIKLSKKSNDATSAKTSTICKKRIDNSFEKGFNPKPTSSRPPHPDRKSK